MIQRDGVWQRDVVRAYEGGESVARIAARLGPSRGTVARALASAGVVMRPVGRHTSPQTLSLPDDPARLGYLAGLVDADGNIFWQRRDGRATGARLTLHSGTPELLVWLRTEFGGAVRWGARPVQRYGDAPPGRWEVTRARDVAALLTALRPYLVVKRARAERVLASISSPGEWELHQVAEAAD